MDFMGWFFTVTCVLTLTGCVTLISVSAGNSLKKMRRVNKSLDALLPDSLPSIKATNDQFYSKNLGARNSTEIKQILSTAYTPWSVKKKYSELFTRLVAMLDQDGLNVEDQHNVTVIANQLVDTIRIYQSLPTEEQNNENVVNQLETQFSLFIHTLQRIEQKTIDLSLKSLRVNTEFALQKFKQIEL